MLAMDVQTPLGVRLPASSLTTIAAVRRFDKPAPTGTTPLNNHPAASSR